MSRYEYVISSARCPRSGAWNVSAVVDGLLFHRTYYGFTRTESVDLFRETVRRAGYGAFRATVADGGQS